jgi:hypothetical protein
MAIYKSAQGKAVDMSLLAAKNEKIRAVSNMKLNARGDLIDSNNQIIKENNSRVSSMYNNTVVTGPDENTFVGSVTPPSALIPDEELTDEEKQFEDEDVEIVKPEATEKPTKKQS